MTYYVQFTTYASENKFGNTKQARPCSSLACVGSTILCARQDSNLQPSDP